jgi:hypothetical protein
MTLELGNNTKINGANVNFYSNYGDSHVELNKPFLSKRKGKKYSVYVLDEDSNKIKLIHFGDSTHEQYHDKLGFFKKLNHGDDDRRRNYRKRASNIRDKKGRRTFKIKWSPNYWSYNILW